MPQAEFLTVLLEADGSDFGVIAATLRITARELPADRIGILWPAGREPLLDLAVTSGISATGSGGALAVGEPTIQSVPIGVLDRPQGLLWAAVATDCRPRLRLLAAALSRSAPIL